MRNAIITTFVSITYTNVNVIQMALSYHTRRRTVSQHKKRSFELCPQEVRLRPYLLSGIASHVYFLKWPREGRSVIVLLMRLHRPRQWFFLSPEKLYFSSCDSVLLGVRYSLKLKKKKCIFSTLCINVFWIFLKTNKMKSFVFVKEMQCFFQSPLDSYISSTTPQIFSPNATTCPLWTAWSPLPVVAEV
jgi:hypothetical protein